MMGFLKEKQTNEQTNEQTNKQSNKQKNIAYKVQVPV